MSEIDFITAFGRLMCDGNLRDSFTTNPEAAGRQINLRNPDLPEWLQLNHADMDFQADVLLRKRLNMVKIFAPETGRRLEKKLWPLFREFARSNWPPEGSAKNFDAFQFCQHLKQVAPEAVVASEWNRLSFALSKRRLSVHWSQLPSAKRKTQSGLQILLRGHGRRWREFFFYLGL